MANGGGLRRILLTGAAGMVTAALMVLAGWIGPTPPPAAGAFQQSGCWNTVWGTDNDGHFFTILAGEGCPDFRGRVFAGSLQRGPTIAATGGRAKMTGVDACRYPTVEVKGVAEDAEVVVFRFKWTAQQLGCTNQTRSPGDSDGTPERDVPAPFFRPEPSGYVPFEGVLITAVPDGAECAVAVSGSGSPAFDVTLNGIAKLSNGEVSARPFFSFWISPEGGNRWTDGAFLAAALTDDCRIQVFRTLEAEAAGIPTTATSRATPTPSPSAAPATTPATISPATSAAPTPGTIRVDLPGGTVVIEPCGTDGDATLVCISHADGAWIEVDSVPGFGEFRRLDGNTVVYALAGDELRVWVRTAATSAAQLIDVFVSA